ncbi:heavy-metal-associated domain-containing protein [Sinomonas sp. JGH33]|uniref:Heavy-metal-associated domain-containing protein n=1 Tax=Sinomonas terricola TaxID=3110330 RepID=A0ABU5T4W7_9MICC|nr:heavy-metal-associated domain-containing protein [Sinomonas sp. JGH33]MEA5454708.1 heavy-metal-associated domain-containing protein [Sinomonas sp. JGH33]
MNTATRLGLYAAGLALAFGAAFTVAGAAIPKTVVAERMATAAQAHGGHDSMGDMGDAAVPHGVTLAAGGYQLGPVRAPAEIGSAGTLSFTIDDAAGHPLRDYAMSHDQELHLIVVRTDGSEFRHVHPERTPDGTWTIPWIWRAAGSYRVFADFVPGGSADSVTLTRTVDVAGPVTLGPVPTEVRTARVDGFDVTIAGDLRGGASSELTVSVAKNGAPVATLQPYLGAFGHLVVLRDGDLAYLHVHPKGADPQPGQVSGPTVTFAAETPSSGRYLLYFDFKVDGAVHTAAFVLSQDH